MVQFFKGPGKSQRLSNTGGFGDGVASRGSGYQTLHSTPAKPADNDQSGTDRSKSKHFRTALRNYEGA